MTGERRQPIRGGYATKSAAQEGLDEMRDMVRRGIVAHDQGETVASWLRRWLADGERDERWEPTTLIGYRKDAERHIIPAIGHLRLRDLQRAHVAALLAVLAERDDTRTSRAGMRGGSAVAQRSARTLDKIRRTLRSALSTAVQDGLMPGNPALGRFREIGRRNTAPASWWQPDELQAFLDSVTDDHDVALWTLIALTGLRRSEALGLRWDDIDFGSEHPGLTVRQRCSGVAGLNRCPICHRDHRGRLLRPRAKSAAGSDRWVPLVGLVVVELTAHRDRQRALVERLGDHWSEHGLVFCVGDDRRSRALPGTPLLPDSVTDRHRTLVTAAGLPEVGIHEMRHGAVSLLAAAGMPIDQIALIVGHSTEEITRLVYVHGIKSTLSAHAQAAADLLRPTERP